jgi:hypothetical protein
MSSSDILAPTEALSTTSVMGQVIGQVKPFLNNQVEVGPVDFPALGVLEALEGDLAVIEKPFCIINNVVKL